MTSPAPVPAPSGRPGQEQPPGQALLDAVAVMDTLRSPGGCPWDAAQTPSTLLRYLVEECYELVDAIERGDRAAVREELGDVLLQVLFHARIASETPRSEGGFDIDDVAGDLVAKLVRRHPHVFADPTERERLHTAEDQQRRWDELKTAEPGRSGPLDGVPLGQPAAALAGKIGARAARHGVPLDPPGGDSVGERLYRIAAEAGVAGLDPESELRAVARAQAARLQDGHSPG